MRRYLEIAVTILISVSIWLIYGLSRPNTDMVTVLVNVHSNIEGRAAVADDAVQVVAVCRATGFKLVRLGRRATHPESVFIDASDIQPTPDGFFNITAETIFHYADEIFGSDISVQSMVSQNVRLRFALENNRKVPVKAVQDISYRSQYTALEGIKLVPDSVLIYGEPSRLESIDQVLTRNISLHDVQRSAHGMVRLEQIAGVRLSDEQVAYNLDVTRYVELRSQSPVQVRHVPAGATLSVYPSSVQVSYKCVFPVASDPAEEAVFYVDYTEFAESLTGKCLVHCDNLPSGVIECRVEPQVCDCVELR